MASSVRRGRDGAPFSRRTPIWIALLTLLLTGCGDQEAFPMSTVNPQSEFAEVIHSLYVSIFWWTMLILAIVWVLLAYVILRYRRRSEDEQPRQIRGHMGLEIGWTVGPALVVVAITIPTIQAVFETQRPVAEDAMEVHVTGNQFWWEFHYPDQGVTTANELRLPVGQPVNLRLESNDVIHSFWVPLLGGKRDVNPEPAVREGAQERHNWLFFTPRETGVYRGQCAEFCGSSHALMQMRVVVQAEEDFQGWIDRWHASEGAALPDEGAEAAVEEGPAAQGADLAQESDGGEAQEAGEAATSQEQTAESPQVVAGREIFLNSTCIACHAVEGTGAQGAVGPNLTLFGTRETLAAGIMENNRENLARWITAPHLIKPGVQMPGVDTPGGNWPATGLTEDQVQAVAAYLLSLR